MQPSSLVGSGHIDEAAIISAAGDSVWATSPKFSLKPEELKAIAAIFEANSQPAIDKAYSEGLHVAGEKYVATIVSAEDNIAMIRKGKTGVAIAKTKQAIVVGHYGENAQASNARATVEALADYLRKQGY
ncbi:profilin [Sporothrix brasiliensis 5110]|uniref:Profilin n=1 Tax=Sporothrix brasiliensis 5110 TaxID=1398154 RepID=A0A0C2EUR9_9PEZI|nr:profilin [Sporothrix brasiliensis 5110]KIH90304.1 profilin [Sporothrix brasiliensis 5110]